jgi:uncharacterized membrane protein
VPNLHVLTGAGPTYSIIRKIGFADLKDAAAKGIDDFWVMPTHVIFLALIYPIVGLFLARMTFGHDLMPLLFPLAAGFALIGPFAAIGLYELSRQREKGVDVSWTHAFGVLRCPSLDGIAALGMVLMIVFLIWLITAQWLYQSLFGYGSPESIGQFLSDILTTPEGWILIIAGNGIGFLFAVLVLNDQRRFLPAAAGSGCRRDGRDAHVGQSGSSESADDGGLGAVRRRHPGDRLVAILRWARGGAACARPFDLASLPQGRGTGPEPATGPRQDR